MTYKAEARIFREVLAALLGSKLSAKELRELSRLLMSESPFVCELGRSVHELANTIEPQSSLFSPEEIDVVSGDDEGLVGLAYAAVQRKRLAKRDLINIMVSVSPKVADAMALDMPSRDLLRFFFDKASTSQARSFLGRLGMNVSEDPYLGGITNRSKG